jgi:GST-like protein
VIELWTWATPNGHKVHIALEELGLPYKVIAVNIGAGDQFKPEFLKITPNHRIPAIVDSDGPGGEPFTLFESAAILIYLSEKTGGKLIPKDPIGRYKCLEWIMFQMGGIGPMFGQVGFFNKFAGKEYEDKRPLQRYVGEAKRLLGVMDVHLKGRQWFMDDDYTIADISMLGWVRNIIGFYEARDLVDFDSLKYVPAWLERGLARPAVQRGLNIPKRP